MFNLFFLIGSFFQGRVSNFLLKILKAKEEIKESHYLKFKILNTTIWIIVGILFVLSLDNPFSLGGLMVLLAYRSGASLSRRFIFGIHDVKIMKNHLPENKVVDLASFIIKFGVVIDLLFMLTWGILYQYLSVSVNSLFGIEVNLLTLFLWIAGFVYGLILSVVQGLISKQFLLKNELGIALMFSGEIINKRIKKKKDFVKKLFNNNIK
ncbi:MAG: hypothetical protein EU542_07985 [Promethearchaeota archaeon]|nr:MAG: hypothetical protein EU542_07985 [Candidatus Lokiarchaeota archaeon]